MSREVLKPYQQLGIFSLIFMKYSPLLGDLIFSLHVC